MHRHLPKASSTLWGAGMRMEDDPPGMSPVSLYISNDVLEALVRRYGRGWQREMNAVLSRSLTNRR